jgi:3-oxoacyl-[acyl-carrier protein] reductase
MVAISTPCRSPRIKGTHAAHDLDRLGKRVRRTDTAGPNRPDDIGDVVVFIASNESRWLTGENPIVSGGLR